MSVSAEGYECCAAGACSASGGWSARSVVVRCGSGLGGYGFVCRVAVVSGACEALWGGSGCGAGGVCEFVYEYA